jgi:PncC family amidohydrolase
MPSPSSPESTPAGDSSASHQTGAISPLETALATRVLQTAIDRDMSIAVAESCTGGRICSILTSVEEVSHALEAGFIVYSDAAKHALLGIDRADIKAHGAVSQEIVVQMASRAVQRASADCALALSGFTGPVGTPDNGLVHIAVAIGGTVHHREFRFGDVSRHEGQRLAAIEGMLLLEEALDGAGCNPAS